MKKLLLVAFLLLLGGVFSSKVFGQSQEIPMQIIDTSEVGQGNTKSPSGPFVINQKDNFLSLPSTPADYTLELRDENGILVYDVYIPAGTTEIILPTTLYGTFEIRLVATTYFYIGYITL